MLSLLLLYSSIVHNSNLYVLYIEQPKPIQAYSDLIYAINMVEAGIDSISFDNYAYNEKEQARGAFQIRPCRLEHYNKLTGRNISQEQLFDYSISLEIFLYFARQYGSDYETIAKRWNGSGQMTEDYWKKVQSYIY